MSFQSSKQVCKQLLETGFLADLQEHLLKQYFLEFCSTSTDEQRRRLRDKVDALDDVLNVIRENAIT